MTDTKAERPAAPERPAGLTIRRVFTTGGVHPYDEVTWGAS